MLAAFSPETSGAAIGASTNRAADVATVLEDKLIFGVFEQLRKATATNPHAASIAGELDGALRQDEVVVSLAQSVRLLALRAQEILKNKGDSKQAEEVVALRLQVEELKTQVQQLLDSGLELHKKRGRVAMQQAA